MAVTIDPALITLLSKRATVAPSARLGAGLSGLAAPFLGQTWNNPNKAEGMGLTIQDLMLMQMMQGNLGTGVPGSGVTSTGTPDIATIAQTQTQTPPQGAVQQFTQQVAPGGFNPNYTPQLLPMDLKGIKPMGVRERVASEYFYGNNPLGGAQAFKLLPGAEKNLALEAEVASGINKANIDVWSKMAENLNKNRADADKSVARDAQQLQLLGDSFKDNYSWYKEAKATGLAGNVYKKMMADAIIGGKIDENWAIKAGVSPQGIQNAASFVANRNEIITKMQPILTQQFGERGSIRVMESLLNMAAQEVPGLEAGENVYKGKVKGTLKTLFRFAIAGDKYAERFKKSNLDNASQKDIDNMASRIWSAASSSSVENEKEVFNDLTKYVFGEESTKPSVGKFKFKEGQTATNPSTGETLTFRGGKWQ